MAHIAHLDGQEILDSRGNPTLLVTAVLDDGSMGQAGVPSGASTGSREAAELRDGNAKRYGGKGVQRAVANIQGPLAAAVIGRDAGDQAGVDGALIDADGTDHKAKLGANAILGVSLAVARAQAHSRRLPLYRHLAQLIGREPSIMPVPFLNILNGGRHAANSTDFQEYMVVPYGATSFAEALRWAVEVYQALGRLLHRRALATTVGDEGGYAPTLPSNEAAVEIILEAIREAGYRPDEQLSIALDPAASEFYKEGQYQLRRDARALSSREMVGFYEDWLARFPIVSLEDGLAEQDWEGWEQLNQLLGNRVQIVGDDIFVRDFPFQTCEGGVLGFHLASGRG